MATIRTTKQIPLDQIQPHPDLFAPNTRGNTIADRIDVGDCWEWTGACTAAGYGVIRINYVNHYLHRLMWETLVGPIPDGLEIDHLCRNRKCCNPDHLDTVDRRENLRRGIGAETNRRRMTKTHCHRGHPLSEAYVYPDGKKRQCRKCRR